LGSLNLCGGENRVAIAMTPMTPSSCMDEFHRVQAATIPVCQALLY
jgi:hypothetical protein